MSNITQLDFVMMAETSIPVVIGVGDVINRSLRIEDAREPRNLMVDAIRKAACDTGVDSDTLLSSIDSIDVVPCWTWPYEHLPTLIAQDLDVKPRHEYVATSHGGNQPAKLFDDAARRISTRSCNVAVICGGEALASLSACVQAKRMPPPGWTPVKRSMKEVFSPTSRELEAGLGASHGIGAPIQVYPLYENAFRAHRGQSIHENSRESAELYAQFAAVAATNPFAWNHDRLPKDADAIMQISPENRMICFPYPLLMNAFNTVNIAGACILTSVDYARKLGVHESKWIYPLGGAGTSDSYNFWERPNYYSSPCISRSLDAALEVSELAKDDIDLYDFYSCFPIVPKLACHHLGLSITRPPKPITLLGGLTSFGGAGNNYSMHALTEMVRQLRSGKGRNGLVLANGGVVTYQHVVCLSKEPRRRPYPGCNLLPEVLTDTTIPPVEERPDGDAIIETYTVDFGRDGKPARGHVVGRLRNGKRFIANHADEATLLQLSDTSRDPIGRHGRVSQDPKDDTRNLFSFTSSNKL